MNRQKELDLDPKEIQQIEFTRIQLKNMDNINVDRKKDIFTLTILEEIKKTRLKFFQGTVTVL